MNPLLKRQIRKFLPEEYHSNPDIKAFINAIDKSYNTSEEQFGMLQRAASLSSDELFESNKNLKKETESQKKFIDKLHNVIKTLKSIDTEDIQKVDEGSSLKMVDFIDSQTQEIIKINKQKDKLVASLERQNRELNDYAHMISHDLKSPLQSLDALTTWIKEDYSKELGEGGREIVNLIRENVEKMDTLIDGILEYSTIGKIEKRLYKIDLNVLIEDLLFTIPNPNDVKVVIPKKLPSILGDQHRLELLFYHLIENAIKFNDKGKKGFVEINFEEKDKAWKFSIKDNGKGIDEQFYEKIFIAFQKLENDYKSTGIGLSIVKKIVETYQGKIWVTSELNKETTFYFTLKK